MTKPNAIWCAYEAPRPNSKLYEQGVCIGRYRRKRIACPLCGRMVFGWVFEGLEQEGYSPRTPKHKRKGWWKRTKQRKKYRTPVRRRAR